MLHATKAMKTKTKLLPFLITALKSAEKNSQFALITTRKARQSQGIDRELGGGEKVAGFFLAFPVFFLNIFFADEAHFDERIAATTMTTTSQLWQHGNKEKRNNSRT